MCTDDHGPLYSERALQHCTLAWTGCAVILILLSAVGIVCPC